METFDEGLKMMVMKPIYNRRFSKPFINTIC